MSIDKAGRPNWSFKPLAAILAVAATFALGGQALAQSPASETPSNQAAAPAVTQAAAQAVASALSGGISSAAGSIGIAGYGGGRSNSSLAKVPTPGAIAQGGHNVSNAWSLAKSGLSAAAEKMGVNLWMQGSYISPKSTFAPVPGTNDTRFDGSVWAGLLGADMKLEGTPVVLGVAGGYQKVDITTTFNSGTLKQTGWGVTPYAVIGLDKNFFIDVSAGYWWLDTDMTRSSGAITGQTDGTRWNVGANLNGSWVEDGWVFGAQVGYLYIKSKDDAFTESNAAASAESSVTIGQGRIGGTVGYEVEKDIVPYFGARVEHNFKNPTVVVNNGVGVQPDANKTGYRPMIGLRMGGDGDVSGDISANTLLGKSDYEEWGVSGTLRLKF